MTDADALLDAIWATPDDDLVRLVYADWLDDHDEPEQAAFIRVQCEVARLSNDNPDRVEARKREKAAWAAMKKRRGEPLTTCGITQANYHRGFVYRPVRVPAPAFVRYSAEWWPNIPIRLLSITDPDHGPDDWAMQPYLSRIEELTLEPAAGRVRHPSVYYIPTPYNAGDFDEMVPSILNLLAKCKYLERLRILKIGRVLASRSGLYAIAEAPWIDGLRKLEIEIIEGGRFAGVRRSMISVEPQTYLTTKSLRERLIEILREKDEQFLSED